MFPPRWWDDPQAKVSARQPVLELEHSMQARHRNGTCWECCREVVTLRPQQLQPHQDKILPRYCGACSSPGAGSSTSSFWVAARSLGPDPTCAENRDKRPLLLRGESTSGVHPQQDHLFPTPGFAAARNTKDNLIHPRLNLLDASKDSAIFSHAKSFSQ